jgi:hypothetical protein
VRIWHMRDKLAGASVSCEDASLGQMSEYR